MEIGYFDQRSLTVGECVYDHKCCKHDHIVSVRQVLIDF